MAKQGDINLYGFLSELLNYGQKRIDRKRTEEALAAKAEAEQQKRMQELLDWQLKEDYKAQQTRQREQAKEIQKQRQEEIAKRLFGIVQEGEVEVPVRPVNEADRLPSVDTQFSVDAQLPDYAVGASSAVTPPSVPLRPQDYQQLIGEILPLNANLGNYAKQIVSDRFKPETTTDIIQANKVPGYEKYHKDWVLERKSTYDPATGKTSYSYENPRRPATHKPSEYTSFVPADKVDKKFSPDEVVEKVVKTDQYGDVTVSYSRPFPVSETNGDGQVSLTAPVKDFIKKTEINRIKDIELKNYVSQNTKIHIERFDSENDVPEALKPYIVSRGDEGVVVSYQGVEIKDNNGRVIPFYKDNYTQVNFTPVGEVNKQINERIKNEIDQYKSFIGSRDWAIVYEKAKKEAVKTYGERTENNKDDHLHTLTNLLAEEWKNGKISKATYLLYRELIKTEYNISASDLNNLIISADVNLE